MRESYTGDHHPAARPQEGSRGAYTISYASPVPEYNTPLNSVDVVYYDQDSRRGLG